MADGTAYRAIKEAENRGLVAVNDRSGTVRVSVKGQKRNHKLTFGKIAEIASAEILGGHAGLEVEFSRFSIGAMQPESVKKFLMKNSLMIVGDRKDIQSMALHGQSAVLVTGVSMLIKMLLIMQMRWGFRLCARLTTPLQLQIVSVML